jgi:methionyl aminopeptidase
MELKMYKKLDRNDFCWCGSGKKYKMCHFNLDERIKLYKRQGCIVPNRRIIKSSAQIDGIRESGKVNIEILDYIADHIHVGMSTGEIDRLIDNKTRELVEFRQHSDMKAFLKAYVLLSTVKYAMGFHQTKLF